MYPLHHTDGQRARADACTYLRLVWKLRKGLLEGSGCSVCAVWPVTRARPLRIAASNVTLAPAHRFSDPALLAGMR